MACQCKQPDVFKLRDSIQHVIRNGAVVHEIHDEMVCRKCDSVWIQKPKAAEPVKTPEVKK